jgi:predicted HTH domain antitoxin
VATILLDLPDSILLATGQSREEFVRGAKFLLALKLFEVGRISSGRAAELSGLPRIEFLFRAGRVAVPVADLDEEELDREFADG